MDLSTLTPDQIASLKAQLGIAGDGSGRSPLKPRQLHDLRLLPTKDDPRPTFFWIEPPRTGEDLTKTTPYPRLMWHGTSGEEVTVYSASEQSTYTSTGYVLHAPVPASAQDPLDILRANLEAFSPEDRALLVAGQQQDRLAALRAQMAALKPEELETLLAGVETETPKRGVGRPRKEVA